MELSNQDQVISPKPFALTELSEVLGLLKDKITPKTDEEIQAALDHNMRKDMA